MARKKRKSRKFSAKRKAAARAACKGVSAKKRGMCVINHLRGRKR